MKNSCPVNCGVRKALKQLSPTRQAFVQQAIEQNTMTRREIAQLLMNEAKIVVYPGSITRHKTHVSPLEEFQVQSETPQPMPSGSATTARDFIRETYLRLKDAPIDTPNALEDAKAIRKAWYDLHAGEDGLDFSWLYSVSFQALSELEAKFRGETVKPFHILAPGNEPKPWLD